MIRKILVAHGGAEWSEKAFDFALEIAVKYQATLAVISVVRVPNIGDEEEIQAIIESGQERFNTLHERLGKKAELAGIKLEKRLLIGHPAEQIVELAEAEKFDLIVLGHRHRSALGRWLLGSTSDRILDHAPCSVLVVKNR